MTLNLPKQTEGHNVQGTKGQKETRRLKSRALTYETSRIIIIIQYRTDTMPLHNNLVITSVEIRETVVTIFVSHDTSKEAESFVSEKFSE